MDWFNLVISSIAVGISAAAFWRTLFLDRVEADLLFEWEPTLGRAVGKLVIDNPLRQSVYLRSIRFQTPPRQDIRLSPEGSGLHDVVSDAYEESVSNEDDVVVINVRIPPNEKAVLNMHIKKDDTDLTFSFEWSKAKPWLARSLAPRVENTQPKI